MSSVFFSGKGESERENVSRKGERSQLESENNCVYLCNIVYAIISSMNQN